MIDFLLIVSQWELSFSSPFVIEVIIPNDLGFVKASRVV